MAIRTAFLFFIPESVSSSTSAASSASTIVGVIINAATSSRPPTQGAVPAASTSLASPTSLHDCQQSELEISPPPSNSAEIDSLSPVNAEALETSGGNKTEVLPKSETRSSLLWSEVSTANEKAEETKSGDFSAKDKLRKSSFEEIQSDPAERVDLDDGSGSGGTRVSVLIKSAGTKLLSAKDSLNSYWYSGSHLRNDPTTNDGQDPSNPSAGKISINLSRSLPHKY